ncbi:MAG TPA: nuclear transport factor 2 family protein, partial [Blastocatellia bacterium]|nr:nuclear transport factor 2 family protein [Blastocatellia bacterium]
MKRLLIVAILLTSPTLALAQADGVEPKQGKVSATEEELKKITQELLDSVAAGDKAVWDKYLADTCLYSAEDGRTLTKAQLLEELRPLPSGYVGRLRVANPQVREYGDTAIITYDAMEELEIHGQMIKTRFHTTDTYLRRAGRWQMIASQVLAVPSELTPARLNPNLYDDYAGEYELAPGVTYRVSRAGDKRVGQRTGRE